MGAPDGSCGCRDDVHIGDVQCWSDGASGANCHKYRSWGWRKPSSLCVNSSSRHLKLFFDSYTPSQRINHGARWLPSKRLYASRRNNDHHLLIGDDIHVEYHILTF